MLPVVMMAQSSFCLDTTRHQHGFEGCNNLLNKTLKCPSMASSTYYSDVSQGPKVAFAAPINNCQENVLEPNFECSRSRSFEGMLDSVTC